MRYAITILLCLAVLTSAGLAKADNPKKTTKTISEKLDTRVNLLLAEMDVKTAIRHIGEITDTNIVIDHRAIIEMEQKGVRQKVNVKLKNVPLKQALAVTLRTVGLSFAVYDHFIFISTPTKVRQESLERLQTRMFTLKTAAARSLPKVLVMDPSTGAYPIAGPAQTTGRR